MVSASAAPADADRDRRRPEPGPAPHGQRRPRRQLPASPHGVVGRTARSTPPDAWKASDGHRLRPVPGHLEQAQRVAVHRPHPAQRRPARRPLQHRRAALGVDDGEARSGPSRRGSAAATSAASAAIGAGDDGAGGEAGPVGRRAARRRRPRPASRAPPPWRARRRRRRRAPPAGRGRRAGSRRARRAPPSASRPAASCSRTFGASSLRPSRSAAARSSSSSGVSSKPRMGAPYVTVSVRIVVAPAARIRTATSGVGLRRGCSPRSCGCGWTGRRRR